MQTEYFADRWLTKPVKVKNAIFIKTRYEFPDGTTCIEITNVTSNEILSLEQYRGKEPIGTWKVPWGKSYKILDYNFKLLYNNNENCIFDKTGLGSRNLPYASNPLLDIDSLGYQAPVPEILIHQIVRQIVYPGIAMQEGVKGKVLIGYQLNEANEIEHIHVIKGVHPAIDKEAMRCMKLMNYASPALLNGTPVAVCLTQVLTFKLE